MPVESFTLLVLWLILCPFFVLSQVCERASGRRIHRPLTKAKLKEIGIRFRKEQDGEDDEDENDDDDDDDDGDDDDDEDSEDLDDDDDDDDDDDEVVDDYNENE